MTGVLKEGRGPVPRPVPGFLWLTSIVQHPRFDSFIICCILLNVGIMASVHFPQDETWTEVQEIANKVWLDSAGSSISRLPTPIESFQLLGQKIQQAIQLITQLHVALDPEIGLLLGRLLC